MGWRFPQVRLASVVTAAVFFFGAGGFSPTGAQHRRVVHTGPGVSVHAPEALAEAAGEVVRSFPEIIASAVGVLGWDMEGDVSIVLPDSSALFEQSAGTSHIVAYAVPGRDLIVIDYWKLQAHPFTLRSVVMHELFHLLLHRHIPSGLLPGWFEEGVCQWASDGLGEILSGGGRMLDRAVIAGELIPLRALEQSFPRDPARLRLAYEQSKSVVTYIAANHGREALIEILSLMKVGGDLDTAMEAVLGKSVRKLEEDWRASLEGPAAWMRMLSHHLHGLLFAFAGIVALVGFIRVIVRKRKALKEYDDEERRADGT